MREYLDSIILKESIAMAIPDLVSMIYARHGRLPDLPEDESFVGLAHLLLKLACEKRGVFVEYDSLILNFKAKAFWRSVFAIAEIFRSSNATTWDDVLPGLTSDCLKCLDECVLVMSDDWSRTDDGSRYRSLWAGQRTTDLFHFVNGIMAEFLRRTQQGHGSGGNTLLYYSNVEEVIRTHVVRLYNEQTDPANRDDRILQIVSRNQIRAFCEVLLKFRQANVTI
jgi:hypothetical protein